MGRQLFEYHPVLGYRFIPGLRARVEHEAGGYLLRINQAGFRSDREFEAQKVPGSFRVLLFGDSYTAGNGVSNRERFGDLLETLLPDLEVYNFGLPGSGTDQQYLAYRELAAQYDHDLVILAPMVENIHRNIARYRGFFDHEGNEVVAAKPCFELGPEGSLELLHVPVPKQIWFASDTPTEFRPLVARGGRLPWMADKASQRDSRLRNHLQQWSRLHPLPAYDRPQRHAWRLMKAILKQWLSVLRAPAVIFPLPLLEYVDGTASPEAYRARFQELSDPPRVRVHDPLDDLRDIARSQPQGLRFATDTHPTPLVHRVLAQSLARLIDQLRQSERLNPTAGQSDDAWEPSP